jgi:hypothetical protein
VGFTFFLSFRALVHKNLLYLECIVSDSHNILLIYAQVLYGQKHNSTMVSDASPGTAAPKMNKSFIHMAHVSSNRACAQDGYLKRPHPIIIDGDMRWDSAWLLGGFGVGGHWTCN